LRRIVIATIEQLRALVEPAVRKTPNILNRAFQLIRRNAGLLGVVFFLGVGTKTVGFAREVYISSRFGVSPITDSFFAVQQIPTMLSNYIFGAFTLAFVPQYASLKANGRAAQFLRDTTIMTLACSVILTVTMVAGAQSLIPWITGLTTYPRLTAGFSMVLAISIIPLSVNGLAFALMHAEGQSSRAMMVAAVPPVAMFCSLLLWLLAPREYFSYALPWSFVAGSVLGGAWGAQMIMRVARDAGKVSESGPRDYGWRFVKQLFASSVENAAFNANQFLTVHFAAVSGGGAVALNVYSQRIAMLASSGVVTPLNQVAHSRMAWAKAGRARKVFIKLLAVMVPSYGAIALGIFLLRGPAIRLIYQRGAFTAHNTHDAAQALVPYSIYFFIMALNTLFARYFFVAGRGQIYTGILLVGYLLGNALKPFWGAHYGLPGIIAACVVGEGLALFALAMTFVLTRERAIS